MGAWRLFRTLLARCTPPTQALLVLATLLETAARVVLVLTSILIARSGGSRLIAMTVLSAALFGVARVVYMRLRASVRRDLAAAVVDAVLAADVTEPSTDDRQRVVFEGIHHGGRLMAEEIPQLGGDGLACLLVLPMLAYVLDARILEVALAAFGVAMLGAVAVRRATRRLEERAAEADGRIFRGILGALEGRLEIVARGRERSYAETFATHLDEQQVLVRRSSFYSALLGRVPLAAAALIVFVVLLLDSETRTGLQSSVIGPVLVLGAAFPTLRGAAVGIAGFVRGPVLVRPFAELLTTNRRPELTARSDAPPLVLPAVVRLDDVSFRYADSGPSVLARLSHTWDPSEPLVIVGPNGAGKSTLLRLLLGLRVPTSGSIRFGDIDLETSDVVALRRRSFFLPQRPYLGEPYATIRSALELAYPSASDAEMLAALVGVGLKQPLDTTIGRLSAGQRQRVGLARAALSDAVLYLFDEPDADLDREGAELVAQLAHDLCAKGKMVVVAAHGTELRTLTSAPLVLEPAT